MSLEAPDVKSIYEYIQFAPATTRFFEKKGKRITRIVSTGEGHDGLNRRTLPWVCFEGKSPKMREQHVSLFWEIVEATHTDRRSLVIEVGPAHSISPIQTACFLNKSTVIGLDGLQMPNLFYRSEFLGDIFLDASVVLSFQLSTLNLDLHRAVNADRVQLIAHASSTLLEVIPESAKMVKAGGELLVVCEDDLQKRYPIQEELQKRLPKFVVRVNSMSVNEINLKYGFNDSSHLQVCGLEDPTPISVITAKLAFDTIYP
jgi:hypothetical protein